MKIRSGSYPLHVGSSLSCKYTVSSITNHGRRMIAFLYWEHIRNPKPVLTESTNPQWKIPQQVRQKPKAFQALNLLDSFYFRVFRLVNLHPIQRRHVIPYPIGHSHVWISSQANMK